MLIQISSTAANSAIQTDLLRNSIHRLSSQDRAITGAYLQATSTAVTGSLFVADVSVADLVAQSSAPQGLQLFPVDSMIPGGDELRFIINSQDSTPVATTITVQIDEVAQNTMGGYMA